MAPDPALQCEAMNTERRIVVPSRGLYWATVSLVCAGLIYALRGILTPIFLSYAIAYLLDPLVDRFEKWRVPRPLGVVIVLGGAAAAFGLFVAIALPGILGEVASVVSELPSKAAAALTSLTPWLEQRGVHVPQSTTEWVSRFGSDAKGLASSVLAPAGDMLGSVFGGILTAVGSVAAALI